MAAPHARSGPYPSAGRPAPAPASHPSQRAQPPPRQHAELLAASNMYDNPLDDRRTSGAAALGMLMSGDIDSDDDDDDDPTPPPVYASHAPHAATDLKEKEVAHQPIPLAAPKPGYVAPVAHFNLQPVPSAASPPGRQPTTSPGTNMPEPQPLRVPGVGLRSPSTPVPSSPHPLPQMAPITPVFARPAKPGGGWRDSIRFITGGPIIRGDREETLLPKRGEKGDDFWRRFSMVVKEDAGKKDKESAWLKKTRTGSSSFSRWVWVVGLLLLVIIAGACGLGWYVSHNDHSDTAPKAAGGRANEVSSTAALRPSTAALAGSSSSIVTPTRTLNDRALPTPPSLSARRHHSRLQH